jgi:hypothetical protein
MTHPSASEAHSLAIEAVAASSAPACSCSTQRSMKARPTVILRCDLGELEPGVLEIRNWPAKGLSSADVVQRRAVGSLHCSQRTDADHHALVRQIGHQLIKALPFDAAEQVLGRDPHLLKKQLRGILGLAADFIEQAPDPEARAILGLDEHQRDAARPLGGIGLADDDD